MSSLLWLRRDLRLRDHPALRAALAAGGPVVPVFCFDDGLLKGRHASGPRTQFLLECLADLDGSLRQRGSRLFVRHGAPQRELPALARALRLESVHYTSDVSPFARARESDVRAALEEAGVAAVAHPGMFAVDHLEPIRTGAGDPYTVFTPFYRNWRQQPRRPVLGAPRGLEPPGTEVAAGRLPQLADLGLEQECSDPAPGGEQAGREALRRFLAGAVHHYADGRDALTGENVSRLSPYLHFGCLSPREIEERLPDGEGASA
ncbi:MAG: deoxyribodipyrimidine photo-lyase, partial [Solirubrobacteraceae bacterium]